MTWLLFTAINFAFGQTASLYEASQGRLGLGLNAESVPVECKHSLDMTQVDWVHCSQSAHDLFILNPTDYHLAMWSVVAALRAEQLDKAFDEFEPLLIFLQEEWSEDYWSIVLLEAWLLFEVGLQREALRLLKEVPNDSVDASGKHILLFTEYYTQKSSWTQDRFWERAATDGLLTSWSWWHRANFESYVEQRETFLQSMMHSRYLGQRHYGDFVRFHLEEQKWGIALHSALQGMTQYPNSQHLYKQAIIVARYEQGSIELEHLLQRFPEHTKALLVQSFICTMNQQFQTAWNFLEMAKRYGESSKLFWDLRMEVSRHLSNEIHWQLLKEGFLAFPDEPSWLKNLEDNARTEVQIEEVRSLKHLRQ